jgi:hypothetical protein
MFFICIVVDYKFLVLNNIETKIVNIVGGDELIEYIINEL